MAKTKAEIANANDPKLSELVKEIKDKEITLTWTDFQIISKKQPDRFWSHEGFVEWDDELKEYVISGFGRIIKENAPPIPTNDRNAFWEFKETWTYHFSYRARIIER